MPGCDLPGEPDDHGQEPGGDDVHDVPHGQRLASTRHPAMDAVQAEEEREREHPGSGEPHQRHEQVQPGIAALQHDPEREEEPEQEERLGVADLEQRGERRRGEERDRPHRGGVVGVHPRDPVQHQAREVARHERDRDGAGDPRAEQPPERRRQVGIQGHEGPLVLGDQPGVRQRKLGRISVHRDEPVPLGVPPDHEVADRRVRAETRGLAGQFGCDQEHARRHDAREQVDDRDGRRNRDPAALRGGRQEVVSHARSPRSTSSIWAIATRSSS